MVGIIGSWVGIFDYLPVTDKKAEISIIFSKKIDGSMSAKDFILSLDEKLRAKTL